MISGLEGVGRRSYLDRVCRDLLSLELEPSFPLDETAGPEDLYLWLLGEIRDYGSRTELAHEIECYGKLSEEEKVQEIIRLLRSLCSNGCVPCLVDEGGMLNHDGKYTPFLCRLLTLFSELEDDIHIAVVHKRKPNLWDVPFAPRILYQHLPQLLESETQLLLSQLLKKEKIIASPDAIISATPYLNGYPPSAYFAAQFAQQYGFEALLADKSMLIDFQARRFARFLTDIKVGDQEWFILRYLASETQLQLSALATACDCASENIVPAIRHLIDISLVVCNDDRYSVASPIRDAVFRAKGAVPAEYYKGVLDRFTKSFWSQPEAAPSIEVVDATLNAVARSGSSNFNQYQDLVRASTVHRLARECYHKKSWTLALDYARRAQIIDPNRRDAAEIEFKALVQLEEWKAANEKLADIRRSGSRTAWYLQGFLCRKKHDFKQAIQAFEAAIDSGDRSYAVYRDLADCLYRVHKYEEALVAIKNVLNHDSENIFVLDLVIRIALESKKFDLAEEKLQQLERYDVDRRFINHRQSRYLSMKGLHDLALIEANKACETGHAPFESYALRIDIEIDQKHFTNAHKHLEELQILFRKSRLDIQKGLRCKLLTREGKWRAAKTVWDSLEDKSTAMVNVMLKNICQLKAEDTSIGLSERTEARNEIRELERIIRDMQIAEHIDDSSEWLDSAAIESETTRAGVSPII